MHANLEIIDGGDGGVDLGIDGGLGLREAGWGMGGSYCGLGRRSELAHRLPRSAHLGYLLLDLVADSAHLLLRWKIQVGIITTGESHELVADAVHIKVSASATNSGFQRTTGGAARLSSGSGACMVFRSRAMATETA